MSESSIRLASDVGIRAERPPLASILHAVGDPLRLKWSTASPQGEVTCAVKPEHPLARARTVLDNARNTSRQQPARETAC